MGDFKKLIAYRKAYKLAMDIYFASGKFPAEEKYSLVAQIRRSSRSVCANFAEAYSKRRYKAHFISKLSDCESENKETEVWLDFSRDCLFLSPEEYLDLFQRNSEVQKLLFHMINNPEKYI